MTSPGPRYASVEGVRDLLSRTYTEVGEQPERADPIEDDTGAAMPESSIVRRIRTAANQVDVALAPYYVTPFAGEAPGIVEDVTEAIAAYLVDLTHRQAEDLEAGDPVRLRYEWATTTLEAIAAGRMELPGLVRKANPTTGHGSVAGEPRNPIDGAMFTPADFGLYPERGGHGGWDVR